jgi:eukaryotic-like serine/threonine-protein kinase
MSSPVNRVYEFGPFRLDPQKRILARGDATVVLTPKALETLLALVENRNRVVLKDDLMKMLWPDSFVEESNLSQNIFLLRKALGDSTQAHRYILTVPGQGYRFTETVREVGERVDEESLVLESRMRSRVVVEQSVSPGFRIGLAIVVIGLSAAVGVWWWAYRSEAPGPIRQSRLTANPPDLPVTNAAISGDGKYLGYSDQLGIHLKLIKTGATQSLPLPLGLQPGRVFWDFESWYPDSTRFVARLAISGKPAALWSVAVLGGAEVELIADVDSALGVSPDGSAIAFSRVPGYGGSREIWLMGPEGESPHKILTALDNHVFRSVAWSPSSSRIAYDQEDQQRPGVIVESCDRSGQNQTTILSDSKLNDFAWVPPDRFIYARTVEGGNDYYSNNLWDLKVAASDGIVRGRPHRLTDWSGFWLRGLNATADGKHLQFLRGTSHESIFVGDLTKNGSRLLNPRRLTMDDYSDFPLAWMPDSGRVIFSSLRTNARQIFTQALDGGAAPQILTSAPSMDFFLARVAPDGASVLVEGRPKDSHKMGIYRVALGGGVPQLLFETGDLMDYRCTNSPANFCGYGRLVPDQKEMVITRFDPFEGKREELLRIAVEPGAEYHWSLSPDGTQVGILESDSNSGLIRLIQVHGGKTRTIAAQGYLNLSSLDWAINSDALFVSSGGPGGSRLLHVSLDGTAETVWQQPQSDPTWGIHSPDGRRLAMLGQSIDSNVWIIDDF